MPYIKTEKRRNDLVNIHAPALDAGELNYQITKLFIDYLNHNGLNYQRINDVVGAAQGAMAEFQRRVVAPYEDDKIAANGDVYPGQEGKGCHFPPPRR